jgi:hypothetical protein
MNKSNFIKVVLFSIYGWLLLTCIFIYYLIVISKIDKGLASNLLVWSATLFATIALLYTFNSWRNQKASDVIANEAKTISEKLNLQLITHRGLMWSKIYDKEYKDHLDQLEIDYRFIERKLNFLEKLIKLEYTNDESDFYLQKKNEYLTQYISFKDSLNTIYLLENYPVDDLNHLKNIDLNKLFEQYSIAHLNIYEILIKICLHHNSLKSA